MGEAKRKEDIKDLFIHGANDGNTLRTIREEYELFPGMVLLKVVKLAVESTSPIWVAGEEGSTMTRYEVVAIGPGVENMEPGDLVMTTGRVPKVFAQNLLAQYVTPIMIRHQPHIIVPQDEIVARVK